MKMKKRLFLTLLAIGLTFGFTGCKKEEPQRLYELSEKQVQKAKPSEICSYLNGDVIYYSDSNNDKSRMSSDELYGSIEAIEHYWSFNYWDLRGDKDLIIFDFSDEVTKIDGIRYLYGTALLVYREDERARISQAAVDLDDFTVYVWNLTSEGEMKNFDGEYERWKNYNVQEYVLIYDLTDQWFEVISRKKEVQPGDHPLDGIVKSTSDSGYILAQRGDYLNLPHLRAAEETIEETMEEIKVEMIEETYQEPEVPYAYTDETPDILFSDFFNGVVNYKSSNPNVNDPWSWYQDIDSIEKYWKHESYYALIFDDLVFDFFPEASNKGTLDGTVLSISEDEGTVRKYYTSIEEDYETVYIWVPYEYIDEETEKYLAFEEMPVGDSYYAIEYVFTYRMSLDFSHVNMKEVPAGGHPYWDGQYISVDEQRDHEAQRFYSGLEFLRHDDPKDIN